MSDSNNEFLTIFRLKMEDLGFDPEFDEIINSLSQIDPFQNPISTQEVLVDCQSDVAQQTSPPESENILQTVVENGQNVQSVSFEANSGEFILENVLQVGSSGANLVPEGSTYDENIKNQHPDENSSPEINIDNDFYDGMVKIIICTSAVLKMRNHINTVHRCIYSRIWTYLIV